MAKRTAPYVPGEQIHEPDILKLNTNENPYPPSPNVIDAIQQEVGRSLRLYPSPTVDSLRHAIANTYELSKENVFVGNGSDEVLAFSFMAFFEEHKVIRFPAITYSFYPVYAKLFNIPYEEVSLQEDFSMNPEAFFQSKGGVIFPNPNAPTSLYVSLDDIAEIVQQNEDQVVIIDEAYIDFASESAVSLVNKYDNVLIVQTMSKSRSLAGLRVGFALGHPDLIEALIRIKDSINSYTMDRLAIAGATAAIKDTTYFQETTRKIIETRQWVMKEMKKRGFHTLASQANFIFASHPTEKAQDIYEKLKQEGVLVRHFQKQGIQNYLRITIGKDDDMKKFFTKLDNIINASHH